jgi:8-oxo-dGTP pyrophosphatase MutT (NUDIX family)
MKERLKQILSRREKSNINDSGLVRSAVLVPIYYKEGQYYVLLTKRAETVKYHKGQISFPGGACEERDEEPGSTALRECAEEIGLAEGVELLGELDDVATFGSGYIISPFVAFVPWPHTLELDPTEVDRVVEMPLSALLGKDSLRRETRVLEGKRVTTYAYHYQGQVVWGATARILKQFLDIFSEAMKEAEPGTHAGQA